MTGTPRRLVSLRRVVSAQVRERYDELWSRLQRAAVGLGAHAWCFSDPPRSGHHLEFLEFADGADPRTDASVGALLAELESRVGVAEVEEWVEYP